MRPRRGVARLAALLCVSLAALSCATAVQVQDASELLNAFADASVSRIDVIGWINLVAGVVLRQAVLLGPNRHLEITAANWDPRQNASQLVPVTLVAGIDFGRNAGLLRLQDNTTLTFRGLEIRNSLSLLGYDFAAVEPQAGARCVGRGLLLCSGSTPSPETTATLGRLLSPTSYHNGHITTHMKLARWPPAPAGDAPYSSSLDPLPRERCQHYLTANRTAAPILQRKTPAPCTLYSAICSSRP